MHRFYDMRKRDIMMKRIALIPVDARPVTYDLPIDLAEISGWELVAPPKEALGFLKEPADFDVLFKWLNEQAGQLEGIVVSIDMILYGGLVPSRINTDDATVIQARLGQLLRLKRNNPTLKIMAFSSTMRISNNYVNEEEKTYWEDYGKEIWTYSYHYHRVQRYGEREDKEIVKAMEQKIPVHILEDYLTSRERNFKVNLQLIDLVQDGSLDLLVFPQDDTSEYGLNIMEQTQLQEKVYQEQLYEKTLIYPGADEVASVLMARMIYLLEKQTFPTYYPIYSGVKGSLSTAMYEDRSIQESVKGQIFALGSHTVESAVEADIILGVNVPGERQGDLALRLHLNKVPTNNRNVGEWVSRLKYYQEKGREIAIADVAYANGADEIMVPQLLAQFSLEDLIGFAAWNTAGNTLGTVIAQSALIHLAKKKSIAAEKLIERQLLLRILDDYVYQSIVRQQVRSEITDEVNHEQVLEVVNKHLFTEVENLRDVLQCDIKIKNTYLPWHRTFEIGLDLE